MHDIINELLDKTQLEGMEFKLYVAIAWHLKDKKSVAYPSVEYLARRINRSPRTVERLLKKLKKEGYLKIKYAAGPHRTNIYELCIPNQEIEHTTEMNEHDLSMWKKGRDRFLTKGSLAYEYSNGHIKQ